MKKQIPNILTSFRIVSVIVGSIFLLKDKYELGITVLTIGAITDFFDGMLARKLDAMSVLGAKLDQVSDKLFSILTCVTLIILGNKFLILNLTLEFIFAIIISIRLVKEKHWAESTIEGKIKTAILFFTIVVALALIKFKILLMPFIVIWIIVSIYQLYSNIVILKKFGTKSIDNRKSLK